MKKEDICCVIITYNIGKEFYKCYDSIKNQVDYVIIVDNGSDKETIDVLNKIKVDTNTNVIFNNDNYGIAKALNIGVRDAITRGYSWILTMDNDSQAQFDMIDVMIKTYNNINEIEKNKIVGMSPNFFDRKYLSNVEYNVNNLSYSYEDVVITSGNLLKKEVFDTIGFFNEEYFIDYVDIEFCLRIFEKGEKIIQVNNAILNHQIGDGSKHKIFNKTFTASNHSALRRYYITRNSLDVYKKYKHLNIHATNDIKRQLAKSSIKIILVEDNKIQKIKYILKGIQDYKLSKFGKFKGKAV
ncbi:MAG: glycosyltransferase family 2 protein [Methanobacteriaceae archaeon]|nr:glycosyltransferase family 2 protein [Methanobacteriaceae archaeon]